MFCKKCGAQLNDGAKFCNVCGAQFENAAPVADPFGQPAAPAADPFGQQAAAPFGQPMAPVAADPYAAPVGQNFAPIMKSKSGKGAKIAIISSISALLVVLVVVVILLFACGGGGAGSIEEAVQGYFEALTDEDLGDIEDVMYPTVFGDNYDSEIYEDEEFIELLIDEVNPGEGKPKFGTVKITEKEKLSKEIIDNLNNEVEDYEGYVKIESGVNITGKINIKVDGESNTYRLRATVVKADGGWYITSLSVGSSPLKEED